MGPLDCFLLDPVKNNWNVYDVEPSVPAYVGVPESEGSVLVSGPGRSHVEVSLLKVGDEEAERIAWSVLLAASGFRPAVDGVEGARSAMRAMDLPLLGTVESGGVVLAVTEPRYFSRRPSVYGFQGLLVYNPFGVVRVG